MTISKTLFLLSTAQSLCAPSLTERFKQEGYIELCDKHHGASTFDALYAYFDEFIEFLQANPVWAQKLYIAKERFIRSPDRNYYATDFFGFYDESKRTVRSQISFYYSTHFHEFLCAHYPEFNKIPEITSFLQACWEIQEPCADVFHELATELGLNAIFSGTGSHAPVLFKVIKYLPSYVATRPHYDGTAFSLFLDSTDNRSLLLCPYTSSLTVDDFSAPLRKFCREDYPNSMLLIPGTLLTEFSIYPTPHIVVPNGNVRYATIAFAMRSNYIMARNELAPLPAFKRC
jgi:hypothetical protein